MNRKLFRNGGALALAGLLLVGLAAVAPSSAEGAPADDLASVIVYPGGIDFLPNVSASRAKLTINGNGKTFSREFAGQSPSIGLFDEEGQLLPDGTYSWHLELLPGAAAARALRTSAKKNGGRAVNAWTPQSGVFTVRGGAIAAPGLLEPEPERAPGQPPLGGDTVALGAAAKSRADRADTDGKALEGAPLESAAQAKSASPVFGQPGRVALEDADGATAGAAAPIDRAAGAADASSISPIENNRKRPSSAEGSNGRSGDANRR